jgi:hypothetical protein
MPGRVILDYLAFVDAFPEFRRPLHNKKRRTVEKSAQVTGSAIPKDVWNISSKVRISRGDLWECCDKQVCDRTDAQALLCPASAPGYSLAKKEWAYFDIDLLEDAEWAPNPLRQLEMSTDQKEFIRDLVMEHSSKPQSNGVVSGKGEGLIFLLHGPPGCGKTLTAGESPLFIVVIQS